MAAELRAALPTFNKDGLVLERSALSKTGFVNVIEVKGKYQARLQRFKCLATVVVERRSGSSKRCPDCSTQLRMLLCIKG